MIDKCDKCVSRYESSKSDECLMCKHNDISPDPCMDNFEEKKEPTKHERMLYGIYSGVYDELTCKEFRELFD